MRFFVTGTDTDVGKTRITAAVARALVDDGARPTIVKLVQTGLLPDAVGDAAIAGSLAGCDAYELARFALPSDPWSAALDAAAQPLEATALAAELDTLPEPLVIEGSGGAATPLNEREVIAAVAAREHCETILVVALRLGCINHALLTLAYLETHAMTVRGAVLVDRWQPTDEPYRNQVRRALDAHVSLLGVVPFDTDAARSVANAAPLFRSL